MIIIQIQHNLRVPTTMFKCALVYFLQICMIYTTVNARTHFEDYCWRDYEGITPSDALQGGLDKNGKPVYIGQVLYQDKLIPGRINQNGSKIYFEWYDKEYAIQKNIKILCSQQLEKFEWIPTQYNEVVHLTNKILIKGGFEDNYFTYIGRVLVDGETSVGKVVCGTDDCFGLYTTSNGIIRVHKVFQILSINPNISKPPIDVRLLAE